jgi:hypothetical protein
MADNARADSAANLNGRLRPWALFCRLGRQSRKPRADAHQMNGSPPNALASNSSALSRTSPKSYKPGALILVHVLKVFHMLLSFFGRDTVSLLDLCG